MDRTGPPSEGRRGKRGNKQRNVRGEKPRFVFKIKLPKLNKVTNEEDKTPRTWMLEPTADKTKTTQSRGQGAAADSDSVCGDVFFFPQRTSSKTTNEKEKAKLTVLRTISKVLEENQLIRQRLSALSQAQ